MGWSVITGFHEKGKLEMRQQLVLKRYFSGWFWLDLLVVGLDWVTTATDSQGKTQRMVRILKTMRMARSLRLLRLMKLKALWEKLLDSITSNMVHVMIGIVRSMLMVTAVTHFVACLWYAVGMASADEGEGWIFRSLTWRAQYTQEELEEDMAYQYFTSFHWALCQFTPASMEVFPTNATERGFNAFLSLFGLALFSSFLGGLTAAVTQLRMMSQSTDEAMQLLRRYLRQKRVRSIVGVRIQKYVEQALLDRKNRMKEKDCPILSLLSRPLRMDLKLEEFGPSIQRHPFFEAWNSVDHHALRQLCSAPAGGAVQAVTAMQLSMGDILFSPGSKAENMYFVMDGRLSYESATKPGLPTIIRQNMWISEVALWSHWVHRGMARAMVYTEVLALSAEHVITVVRQYGHVAQLTAAYCNAFIRTMGEQVAGNELTDMHGGFTFTDVLSRIEDPGIRTVLENVGHSRGIGSQIVEALFGEDHSQDTTQAANQADVKQW